MVVSPLDAEVVYFSASVSDLVFLMEIGRLVTRVLLNSLTRGDLGFDLAGSDGIVAGVKLIELFVDALGDSDGLNCAAFAVFGTVRVNFRQMNWVDGLDSVEVVVVFNLHSCAWKSATHDGLSVEVAPW